MDWYTYMIRAADHSKYNGSHWFRYLRKVIFENGSKPQRTSVGSCSQKN